MEERDRQRGTETKKLIDRCAYLSFLFPSLEKWTQDYISEIQYSYISCYVPKYLDFNLCSNNPTRQRSLWKITSFTHKIKSLLMNEITHFLGVVQIRILSILPPPNVMPDSGRAASPYFKLHHVSWLYNEFSGGECIVSLVLLFIWPVEVEGWIATESCCPHCIRVKTPVFFMGSAFC